MKHLSPSEFVDFIEGTLGSERARHVEACADCRAQADTVRAAWQRASEAEIPDPSPLFWDRFSDRVRDAIAEEPQPVTGAGGFRAFRPWRGLAWGALAALVLMAVIANPNGLFRRQSPVASGATTTTAARSASTQAGGEPAVSVSNDGGDDPAWSVLRSAAADLELEEARAAGLGVRPGAIDRAVLELSPAERLELGRLLQSELKRVGA